MNSIARATAAAVLALAGLLSMVTFTIAMLATGSFGWLVIGWFVGPITAVVWPAILGAWWTMEFYVALAVCVGVGVWTERMEAKTP